MASFICGLRWFLSKRSVTKIALSQWVFEITRDFKFFWKEDVKAVHMKSATSANRPATSAKSAIFWMKKKNFSKSWKMTQIPAKLYRPEVADGSNLGRKHVQLVPKLLLHTHNVQKYVLHVYLWKKRSLTKFFSKKLLQNWKKIHIFSEVNPLEKIEKKKNFSSLKFGNFFFKK